MSRKAGSDAHPLGQNDVELVVEPMHRVRDNVVEGYCRLHVEACRIVLIGELFELTLPLCVWQVGIVLALFIEEVLALGA